MTIKDFCSINSVVSQETGSVSATIMLPLFDDPHFEEVNSAVSMLFGGDSDRIKIHCVKMVAGEIRVAVECPDYAWSLVMQQIKDAANRITAKHNSPLHRFLDDLGQVADTAQRMAKDVATMIGDVKQHIEKAKAKPRIESDV